MATISAAIAWTRDHWNEQRTAPVRLHVSGTEPDDLLGSPRMAPGFWRFLQGDSCAVEIAREETVCPLRYDPDCARCGGTGVIVHERPVFRYPMAAALYRLSKVPATSPGWPRPYSLVVLLASSGWQVARAAAAIGQPVQSPDHYRTLEAAFLIALRKLHSRYASAPLPDLKWTEKSDAQRSAEDAA